MHNIINVPIHPLWRNPQKYPELNPPPPQTQTTPVKTETVAAVTPATTNSDNPKNNPSTNNNNNSKNNNSAEKPPNDNTPSGVSKEVSSEEVGVRRLQLPFLMLINMYILSFVVCHL